VPSKLQWRAQSVSLNNVRLDGDDRAPDLIEERLRAWVERAIGLAEGQQQGTMGALPNDEGSVLVHGGNLCAKGVTNTIELAQYTVISLRAGSYLSLLPSP